MAEGLLLDEKGKDLFPLKSLGDLIVTVPSALFVASTVILLAVL